jgi:YVTN family beta-propeller protein
VSVIDTTTHKVVATVPTGKAPVNPTFTPDRQFVYVANSQTNTITVIDVHTNKAKEIPAGGDRPSGLAFSPQGDRLYVSLISQDYTSPGSVHSIDLATGKVTPDIRMGADPERVALTPDGQHLFVNNLLDGTMAVVDTATNKIIATVMLGDLPFNPLMSPDGSVVYVGVMSAGHIAVVDTGTYQVVRTLPAESPNGISFSLDYQSLFVSNALSGTVQQVSVAMNKVLNTQNVGGLPGNIAVLPDGKHAYMVRPDGTTVEVLDTESLMITETITVGTGPSVVSVCRPKD